MKILVAHNAYQRRGGEDAVVDSELQLLRDHGHEVHAYQRHNDELGDLNHARAAAGTLWSRRTTRELRELLGDLRPDVLHAHNTFPLISPSLYWAAAKAGVPVVQTVHNYRLACPQAMFLRDGRICEDCLGHVPWRAVQHACYRGSRSQTAVMVGMLQLHRALGTWQHKVARWIALSTFSRDKLVAAGLPAARIVVEGHAVDAVPEAAEPRRGLLFVGRLSPEKGIGVLARALALSSDLEIDVIGDGPERARLAGQPGVRLHGELPPPLVRRAMQRARALVLPSIVYEQFPRTLVEAFAAGLPVIASDLGALGELVQDGRSGLLFAAGDPRALAGRMRWALTHGDELAVLGEGARQVHAERHTPQRHHAALLRIYDEAIAERRAQGRSR